MFSIHIGGNQREILRCFESKFSTKGIEYNENDSIFKGLRYNLLIFTSISSNFHRNDGVFLDLLLLPGGKICFRSLMEILHIDQGT